jgi:S1-C subfamily serine protease
MKIKEFSILIIVALLLISGKLFSQSGQYVSECYFFYDTKGNSQWTSDNPEYTYHKFIINISVSEFTGKGEITVKDINTNNIVTHMLNGKIKELYDNNTEQISNVYAASLNAYGLSQLETVNLILDSKTNALNAIVTTSVEFRSKGNYIRIKPLEEISNSTGSGFIVSNNGYIITNYHVVKGANKITVKGINGNNEKAYTATLKNYDEVNDIALLKIQDGNYNVNFNIIKSTKEVGENVFVLGYPMISLMGSEIKLTNGIISSLSGYRNNNSYYQISAPIQPGNSGCPLFDTNGNLIGLISAKLTYGENVGYALKSTKLCDFLVSNGINIPQKTSAINNAPLSQKIKQLKPNIIFIESNRE